MPNILPKTFCKKRKGEGNKAKGDTKDLDATRKAIKLSRRDEPGR